MDDTPGGAFLLTQLGAHAAALFAERIAVLDLTPPQSGLLRVVARRPGLSQQAIAEHLGTPATRIVALIDGLEQRGLVERRRNREDRRLYALHLTDAGAALMGELRRVAREHDAALLASLDGTERTQLRDVLARLAQTHGLTPGVHPGYQAPGDDGTATR